MERNTSSLHTISRDNSYTMCSNEIQADVQKFLGHLDHNTFLRKLVNNSYNFVKWKYKYLSQEQQSISPAS